MTEKTIKQKLGFIGAGNMANAICEGLVRKGRVAYSQIYVSGPRLQHLESWKTKGAHITTKNGYILDEADVIFLSVKPHILPEAAANMFETSQPNKATNKLFISILAGVTLESLENILCRLDGTRVVRVMPNTPLMVGEGCVVFCPGQQATEDDIALVKSIFEVSGMCQLVPEAMINGVGALAGSGPAYIYLIIEALSDGAVKMGIPREMATSFAAQTVLGAAKMVLETGKHPGALKDEVCSPGGTTITGIHALERSGVRSAFMDAVECATRRSAELGQKK
ncbi:hypothetical protein ILUMI_25082 [Ignelater luminosus]|uniref:Pyrroline-5-carboxylate reductase n=1 Tax=Ignelater luminosus TaxID=2038154 RepID=A0A8K0CCB1_IGNLU|nr:hypothetical protein ILUMI_25082 [Ignelater luminosus]